MAKFVIALGGNALQSGNETSYAEQLARADSVFRGLKSMILANEVVITHGNGPQVGEILLQNEAAAGSVPSYPLDVCGSMSQGFIAQMLTTAIHNNLEGSVKQPVQVYTRTIVDASDPAFSNPTKFIGPSYDEETAISLKKEKGWELKKQNGRGWRRVVPSPVPVDILEWKAVDSLLGSGYLPICAGGGGTPMVMENNILRGVEAVIDKDLASSLLANRIRSRTFIILTGVSNVYVDFREKSERAIGNTTKEELKSLYMEGKFESGSMAPKVKAAIDFIERGGEEAIITSLDNAESSVRSGTGTHIFRN
ncbi:MAG: carbamate kinase [Candidatus Thermoplasmatota archaeon]|nr:carbamate kinase [Candidatus Thermoplasmatota archaeon]